VTFEETEGNWYWH